MQPQRFAVVGAGVIGRTHIDAIARDVSADLCAIVDPFDAAKTIAKSADVPCYADIDELIGLKPDGVIVATPNHLHAPQAIALIEAGIPVLVEKPLASDLEGAEAIVAASNRFGVPVLVGHHRRYNPIIRAAKQAVTSGQFGDLVTGSVLATLYKPDSYFDIAWRREAGSGGPLLINAIHEIDLLRHLFGEIIEAAALTSNSRRGFAVEDTATALLRFQSGAVVTLALTDAAVGPWAWDISAGENPGRFPAHGVPSHHFAGSKAGLSLPDLGLWTFPDAPDWTVEQTRETLTKAVEDSYDAQISHFAHVVTGQESPIVSAFDGLQNLRVLAAITASARENRPVKIDLSTPTGAPDIKLSEEGMI